MKRKDKFKSLIDNCLVELSLLRLATSGSSFRLSLSFKSRLGGVWLQIASLFDGILHHGWRVHGVVCCCFEFETVTHIDAHQLSLLGEERNGTGPSVAANDNDTEILLGCARIRRLEILHVSTDPQ